MSANRSRRFLVALALCAVMGMLGSYSGASYWWSVAIGAVYAIPLLLFVFSGRPRGE